MCPPVYCRCVLDSLSAFCVYGFQQPYDTVIGSFLVVGHLETRNFQNVVEDCTTVYLKKRSCTENCLRTSCPQELVFRHSFFPIPRHDIHGRLVRTCTHIRSTVIVMFEVCAFVRRTLHVTLLAANSSAPAFCCLGEMLGGRRRTGFQYLK